MVPKGLAAVLWPVPMGWAAGPLYVREVLVTGPWPAPGLTGLGPTGATWGFHVLMPTPPLEQCEGEAVRQDHDVLGACDDSEKVVANVPAA